MIRYISKKFDSVWTPIDDNPEEVLRIITESNHELISVLSVSEIVDDETTEIDDLKYKGPLYFDIDVKGDIPKAIESTQELVESLQNHGVLDQYILVYCSGSKGFHVMVHAKVFSNNRPMKHLPTIYKEIALKFAVEGLDFVVYSERRGRMWRVPNFKRKNGKYKVSITVEELFSLTEQKYNDLISAPRPLINFPESIAPSGEMKALFTECKKVRDKKEKMALNSKGLGSEHFKTFEGIPNCVEQVRLWDGLKDSAHFNNIVLQTVTYMKASELDDKLVDVLINDMAKNGSSHRFPTEGDRRREIISKLGYVNRSSYKFDCNFMRSILEENPCSGCKLLHACKEGVDSSEDGTLGILHTNAGYFRGDVHISTFILKPLNRFLDGDSGLIDRTVGVEVEVFVEEKSQGSIRLTEDAFQSKGEFLKQTSGMGTSVFFGGDSDIQKIKHNVFNLADLSEVGDIVETYTVGIMETRKNSKVMVYVEPGFSIDQYRTIDTHTLIGSVNVAPDIREVLLPTKEDVEEIKRVLRILFTVNEPSVVAQILGWTAACHLRTHFSSGSGGRREFPLLFLTGNAGVGKTPTAGLFLNLHCVDYLIKDSAPSLGSITEWALIDTCSGSTTTPRVLDEFNRAKMGIKKYNVASEIMKMSWGCQTINRGTISKSASGTKGRTGARTVSIPISSPLVVLGEQQPTEPALLQRSCIVPMKVLGRKGREGQFLESIKNTETLRRIGKAMVYGALRKPLKYAYELRDRYKDRMPNNFDPRPKLTYQIILGGLDFFNDVLKDLDIDLNSEVEELKDSIFEMLDSQCITMGKAKAITEIDRAIGDLAILSMMSSKDDMHVATPMIAGDMYYKSDKFLYLDVTICHAIFRTNCRREHKICVIETAHNMREMLSEEDYCVSLNKPCEEDTSFASGRQVAKLHVGKMKDKGIEVDYFSKGDGFTFEAKPKGFTLPGEAVG